MNQTFKTLLKKGIILGMTPTTIYWSCVGVVAAMDECRAYGARLADQALAAAQEKVDNTIKGFGYTVPERMSIEDKITKEAELNQLDPKLVHAVIHVESRKNKWAKSNAGALGLMQLMPETAKACGFDDAGEAYNQHKNVECGTWWLARAIEDERGDKARALMRYNGGPRCVNRCKASVDYARDVLAEYEKLKMRG